MKQIFLDTNFLMIPAQHKVDIFEEIRRIMETSYELCIVERTLKELDFIVENGKLREKLEVKLTKALIKTKNIKIVSRDQDKGVDEQLIELSRKGAIVATQDMALKKQLTSEIIVLRQRKYLALIGG
jgi:rRNA-processing protein FCF1